MTQPDTLHTRLRDEIERRLAVARAATPGPWEYHCVHPFMDGRVQARVAPLGKPKIFADVVAGGDGPFIALHDPADAIRRYQGELELLERHAPRLDAEDAECCRCWNDWPCIELIGLAQRLGLNAADQAGGLSGQFAAL